MYSVMTKSYNGRYILEEDRQYNLILFRQEEVQSVGFSHYEHIPAWSLHRLVEMIPFTIWHTEHDNSPRLEHTFWFSKYAPNYNSNEDIDFREHPNLYDNIIDCIEWLINEGYFNKDYLEERK